LPRETPTVDRCKNYGKTDRMGGRGCRPAMVPAYCSRGDVGVQCQIARYASYCHGGMEGVNRGMDTEVVGHVANRALLFWCTTAQAINLARREEHMGKDMSTEGLVFDWTRAILRPKVTNRKHARTSRLREPQPPNQPETFVITRLSISALSPFTRLL
jgi:hypothetical protein